MSLGSERGKFTLDIAKLIVFADSLGFRIFGDEWKRTVYQQAQYVKTGRSKTMDSSHIDGLAIDFNFFKVIPPLAGLTWINGMEDKDEMLAILRPLGEYWESLDPKNEWGGFWENFRDAPHFARKR